MKQNVLQGNKGEAIAYDLLQKHSMQILETNFSNSIGEIDIIAQDGKTLVFVEVKQRKSALFGMPREAVTASKQRKIRLVAQCYLKMHKKMDAMCRFDVVEVLGTQATIIKNAF